MEKPFYIWWELSLLVRRLAAAARRCAYRLDRAEMRLLQKHYRGRGGNLGI